MTCHDAEPFLLDPQLDAEAQAHLDTCSDCQSIRTDLMEPQALLRAHMEVPAPPALRTAFYTMLYKTLTQGVPLAITPAEVRQQVAVIEECHRQNPHIYKKK